jgi:dihydroorotase
MQKITRRTLLKRTALAGSLVCALDSASPELLQAQTHPEPRYDLLIRGGRVIDSSQKLSAERDIGIVGQKIAAILPQIPEREARQTLDARGKIVTPGLIDIHAHVYDGVAPLCIPADANSIGKGVTAVVDAGSSGAHTFPGFKKDVINVVDTRLASNDRLYVS